MAHTNIHHRRTHNLLLISKLLSQRDAASPFTLVLDSLEQTAKPLLRDFIRRANIAKTYTILLGFETVRAPAGVDHFVPCYNKSPAQITQAISDAVRGSTTKRHHLLILDSLHPLCTLAQQSPNTFNLTHFLSSLVAPPPPSQPNTPTTSLVAIYHTDVPLATNHYTSSYQPTPLSLLTYLATTILTIHSLPTLLAAKAAQDRSLAPPIYGLDAGKEGVLIGIKPARYSRHLPSDQRGTVLELEHRRKSGRGVREWYFLPSTIPSTTVTAGFKEHVTLLDDHPLFKPKKPETETGGDEALAGMTFELGLSDRQKAEREGVVLPYFDAQKDGGGFGPGEGGRILYDMGEEDDFDEEEDEI